MAVAATRRAGAHELHGGGVHAERVTGAGAQQGVGHDVPGRVAAPGSPFAFPLVEHAGERVYLGWVVADPAPLDLHLNRHAPIMSAAVRGQDADGDHGALDCARRPG